MNSLTTYVVLAAMLGSALIGCVETLPETLDRVESCTRICSNDRRAAV